MYMYLLYSVWANQRHLQVLYPSYSTVYVRCALYSTARDDGDSFSLSYTRKQGQ